MIYMGGEVIEEIEDKADFFDILKRNPGVVVIKFGAEWCAPCKKVHDLLYEWFEKMPSSVACYDLDVDDNFEIYAYLKTKKQVSSIPVILGWKKGNTMIGPDYSVVGTDKTKIDTFEFRSVICWSDRVPNFDESASITVSRALFIMAEYTCATFIRASLTPCVSMPDAPIIAMEVWYCAIHFRVSPPTTSPSFASTTPGNAITIIFGFAESSVAILKDGVNMVNGLSICRSALAKCKVVAPPPINKLSADLTYSIAILAISSRALTYKVDLSASAGSKVLILTAPP